MISLSMGGNEMVYALVSKERILALSGNSHKNEMRSALWNKINDIEEVHDNIEKLIVMEPDIIIAPDWTKKSVVAANPEIILIPIWNSTNKKECSKFFDFIKIDKSMQEIKAIKNGDIYPIPGKYIYMYSQYIIDGIEEIARIVYKIGIEA